MGVVETQFKENERENAAAKKSCLRCTECRKFAVVIGGVLIIGLVAGFFLGGLSSPSSLTPTEIVHRLEKSIARAAPGEEGAALATIEGDTITRKLFDQQLNLFLQSAQSFSQEEIVRRKNDPAFLRQFLDQLVNNRVVLKAIEGDPEMQGNPEMLVFMNLTLADGLQKYYLYKKAGELNISTNVSDQELSEAYDQVRRNPQLAESLNRLPFDEIKLRLSQEIVRQRQMAAIRDHLMSVRDNYRIRVNDEAFGKVPQADATNAAPGQ